MKQRLDQALAATGLVASRSQAESFIRLGKVTVNTKVITKPGFLTSDIDVVELKTDEQYVSRAGLKLASVAQLFRLDFRGKTVLDVGSSTGGFTDYALQHGASKVVAVDVGTEQLHPSLRADTRVELHEKTDIRNFRTEQRIDIVVADVSFISLREILPSIAKLCAKETQLAVMVKPQFEAGQPKPMRRTGLPSSEAGRATAAFGVRDDFSTVMLSHRTQGTAPSASRGENRFGAQTRRSWKHKGVIKNDKMRRDILRDFEDWARQHFVILDKTDSEVAGSKGNRERFYLLRK